jgi:hypothetical protein
MLICNLLVLLIYNILYAPLTLSKFDVVVNVDVMMWLDDVFGLYM